MENGAVRSDSTHEQFNAADHCRGYDVVRGPSDVVRADRPWTQVEGLEHGRTEETLTRSNVVSRPTQPSPKESILSRMIKANAELDLVLAVDSEDKRTAHLGDILSKARDDLRSVVSGG